MDTYSETLYKECAAIFPFLKCYWQNKTWYLIYNPPCPAPHSGKKHIGPEERDQESIKNVRPQDHV